MESKDISIYTLLKKSFFFFFFVKREKCFTFHQTLHPIYIYIFIQEFECLEVGKKKK